MPNRFQIQRAIIDLYPAYLREHPQAKLMEIIWGRYGVDNWNKLTIQQLDDLLAVMQSSVRPEKEYA